MSELSTLEIFRLISRLAGYWLPQEGGHEQDGDDCSNLLMTMLQENGSIPSYQP